MADLYELVVGVGGSPWSGARLAAAIVSPEDQPAARAGQSGFVASLDAYQRRHRWLGFPLAVIYKFADDQGGYLAALITYYGFLSLFPLLLLLVTILGFALQAIPPCRRSCSTRRWRSSRSSAARCATASGRRRAAASGSAVGIW